jgi:hypothetical protein
MPSIKTHRECRSAQRLSFCYLCGEEFLPGDERTRDHLPAEAAFAADDRSIGPVLWLPTHRNCNGARSADDQKLGQLIALLRFEVPASRRDLQLNFEISPQQQLGALANLNLDQSVWRWVRGFHAALYGERLPDGPMKALTLPFARARKQGSVLELDPFKERQHRLIVETVKINRLKQNLDVIHTHAGKLRYECVWRQSDQGMWMCFFAVDLYDWQDLGDAGIEPRRGCAGCYAMPNGHLPVDAATAMPVPIIIPNFYPLEAFAP